MKKYDHKQIEKKWQKKWEEDRLYAVTEDPKKEKSYILVEFPYPSGEGLHVGHIRSYTALDILARKRRAEGKNVLYPIGWDAFGLPTENYAVKTGIHPKIVTKENTDHYRKQLKSLGFSFDWSREINTTDPKYYKWTQWIFLQLYKHGLAYKAKMPINWCLDCKTGLANEEVVDGLCERCGGTIEKREKEQWMLAITKYADRLDKDLDTVDYWDRIKIQQRNWIGRSEGVEIEFPVIKSSQDVHSRTQTQAQPSSNKHLASISVFTTRPDTLFGATYMVLAPEHKLVEELKENISNWDEVVRYIIQTKKKNEIERTVVGEEKTGIELKGVKAINPASKKEIPIFIADYVLAQYGTGAIMAVPAHDERDFAFARTFDLPIVEVISGSDNVENAYTGEGALMNSEKFDGLSSEEAKEKITEFVGGKPQITYKLRDWIFSRQRYWGEPIPMVHCKNCNWVPVPENELPVELPDIEEFKPTDSGESPLAKAEDWVTTTCPKCNGPAKRETDTMPNWAGSSWYYLRYTDPKNDTVLADRKKLEYWTPVDWYNGGMEHTTLHLLYSRFWHKFLYDIKVVPTLEPYAKRTSHGLILAEGGEKMSKSKSNVVNPDEIIEAVGADALRLYEMFIGPFDQAIVWDSYSIAGVRRFIEKVWRLREKVDDQQSVTSNDKLETLLHQTIKKVGEDIENLKFNTAVSQLMILVNALEQEKRISEEWYTILLRLLAPFVPHVAEELWHEFGEKGDSIHTEPWPTYNPQKILTEVVMLIVQVNSKIRARIEVPRGIDKEDAHKHALSDTKVEKWIGGKEVKNIFYVPDRLINIVT